MRTILSNKQGFAPLIGVIIIALIAIGAGGVYMMRRSSRPASPTPGITQNAAMHTNTQTGLVSPTMGSQSGSMHTDMTSLIAAGKSLECDWQLPSSTGATGSGKLWTNGSKGRSTITTQSNGMSFEANAIIMDKTVYSWIKTAAFQTGFKFSPEQMSKNTGNLTEQQKQQAEQYREQMNFDCHAWTPDESKFELPTDITFKSL